ncbi:ABC transporter ATP-binding protein [Xylanimonas oleitrophica]|uniref:ABC transporter ATP-binding protein n=1 Tax=Xylanimonas oleitrophica TaxID=2607479 RepID=A0A2W5Y6C8_9MICO|nr:ATP-binding cassette domain-containing protein [Xylanimonas oleitrophica]PZR53754.1 ABC transporter ATP-binding protein [Xylanimonas oleitrophica]
MAEPVTVSVRAATRTHGTVEVLEETSFDVGPGRAAVVVGPNGSGKTTLLRLVAGADLPTRGTVETLGAPAAETRQTRRDELALLLGGLPTYPDLTVAEHLTLVAAAWGPRHVLGRTPAPGVDEALADAGLTRVRDQYPGELSSGETQMFALACTLYRPGALVIVDEPEQRLDAGWRRRCRDLLLAALDAGRTLVVATHDHDLRAALTSVGPDGQARGVEVALAAPQR